MSLVWALAEERKRVAASGRALLKEDLMMSFLFIQESSANTIIYNNQRYTQNRPKRS